MSASTFLSGALLSGAMHLSELLQQLTLLGVAVLLLVTLRRYATRRGGRIGLIGAALLAAGALLDIARNLFALLMRAERGVESLQLLQSAGLILLVWALLATLRRR